MRLFMDSHRSQLSIPRVEAPNTVNGNMLAELKAEIKELDRKRA